MKARATIAALVENAQSNGAIDPKLNPDAVARAFIAMFYGFVLQKLWDKKTPHQEMLVVFEVFIDALTSPKVTKRRRANKMAQAEA